jgi:hypothetical protein
MRLILIVLLCLAMVGCSALQVKSEYVATVAANAIKADIVLQAAKANQLAPAAARTYLAGDGMAMSTYYDVATPNAFVYLFDAKKKIYAGPDLYLGIKNCALDALENAKRAATCPDADAVKRAAREAQNIIDIDMARKAVKP